MRRNACSSSSSTRARVLCMCFLCLCWQDVMMMDGGQKRVWGSGVRWEFVLWPYIFQCHETIHCYNMNINDFHALVANIHWQRSFCQCVCVCPCLFWSCFTSVLFHVPFVAFRHTAVLPWFYQQMLWCSMRQCPTLHPAAPAVSQFISAYYPESALRWSVHYTSPDQSSDCCLNSAFMTPLEWHSLCPRTGNFPRFRKDQLQSCYVWDDQLRWRWKLLFACMHLFICVGICSCFLTKHFWV